MNVLTKSSYYRKLAQGNCAQIFGIVTFLQFNLNIVIAGNSNFVSESESIP